MYAQKEKSKEGENRAVSNSVTRKNGNVTQHFGFVDNRIESAAQRKLQEMIGNHSVQQNPIQKKATMSGEVIQKGGQLGKARRTTMESISPSTPVPTGGMWLVETDAANGLHQQIRIGQYYHTATAVSFGHNGQGGVSSQGVSLPDTIDGGEGNGVVYQDSSTPKKQIQHTPMTAEQRDNAREILLGLVGQTAPYDLLTNNCAHWSMRHYDDIKSSVKK